jgi:diguanylate cyclase (GGDEF)-like protein/PAS domain S-box-containing protein
MTVAESGMGVPGTDEPEDIGFANDGEILRSSVELRRLTATLSRAFSTVTAAGLNDLMIDALEQVGRFADVDIAFAALVDAEYVTDAWEWAAPHVRATNPPVAGQTVEEAFSSALEVLRAGVLAPVEDIRLLELPAEELDRFEKINARAIALAPVRRDEELIGVVGFLTVDRTHVWNAAHASELKFFANLLLRAVTRIGYRAALDLADARARRIAAFVPDGLLVTDPHGAITWASPSMAAVTGWEPDRLASRNLTDLVHRDDTIEYVETSSRLFGQAEPGTVTVRMQTGAGTHRWFELSLSLVADASFGLPPEVMISVRDVHDRHLETTQLVSQVTTDSLTGVANRVGLRRALDKLAQEDSPIAVAFGDLDEFKVVNDTHGHGVGDDVLVAVAERLKQAVGPLGTVCRIGGDEFVLILRRVADEGSAQRVVDAIAATVAEPISTPRGNVSVTISIGVAFAAALVDVSQLLTSADTAMYQVKRLRRQRARD